MKCQATAAECRCGLQLHTDDVPHVCGEVNEAHDDGVCGGSWYGDSIDAEDFQVVAFPRIQFEILYDEAFTFEGDF